MDLGARGQGSRRGVPNTRQSSGKGKGQGLTGWGTGAGALFCFRKMRERDGARSAAEMAVAQDDAGVGF